LLRMKGVLSLPEAPDSLACRMASSIMLSMTGLGIAASVGTGFAKSRPDLISS
jgi:hypothetical protein